MTTDQPTEARIDPETDTRDLAFVPADPAATRTLRPDQIDHYNEHGFVSPVRVFEPDDARRLRAYVDDLLTAVVDADDPRNAYSVISYHMFCAGLYDLVQTPAILDLVEDVIGPDIVCWGTHLFAKLPDDPKAVPFHQDAAYWPLTPSRSVTVWLAIDDTDAENAAMQFVPGSHREGALPHVERALDGTRVLKREAIGMEARPKRFVNALAAGELSLHSDLLLHGSDANRSSRRRTGLTIRYAAAGVDVLPGHEYFVIPSVHCRGTIPTRWLHTARPDGEHPEVMAGIWGDFDGTPPGGG